jgi:hypothetical protein
MGVGDAYNETESSRAPCLCTLGHHGRLDRARTRGLLRFGSCYWRWLTYAGGSGRGLMAHSQPSRAPPERYSLEGENAWTTFFWYVIVAMGMALSIVGRAFAISPVPAPIVGAGLPALAVLGGGYWFIRKLRSAARATLR